MSVDILHRIFRWKKERVRCVGRRIALGSAFETRGNLRCLVVCMRDVVDQPVRWRVCGRVCWVVNITRWCVVCVDKWREVAL